MSNAYTILPVESRVLGLYHGVPFVGTIWARHTTWHNTAQYHVNLDSPIVVNGQEREGVCVEVYCDTLRDDDYRCMVTAI